MIVLRLMGSGGGLRGVEVGAEAAIALRSPWFGDTDGRLRGGGRGGGTAVIRDSLWGGA